MAPDTERRIAGGEGDRLEPPEWLAKWVDPLSPPGDFEGPGYILRRVWAKHPSVGGALLHLARALPVSIVSSARDSFRLTMAVVQAAILFIAFAGVITVPLLAILAIVFGVLILHEPYILPEHRRQARQSSLS